jgi:hypothetical protein
MTTTEGIVMNTDSVNRWLTLGANVGVLIGIFLLVAELNQNSKLMQAQIFSERASQGIELFMSVAESEDLSDIHAVLENSDYPADTSVLSELSPEQKNRYLWFMRANRFRIENLLYQQTLGMMELDRGPLNTGRSMVSEYAAFGEDLEYAWLPVLLDEVRKLHE